MKSRIRIPARVQAFLNSGDSRSVTVKRNILGSVGVKVANIGIQLLLVPMTLGYLDDELYGIWLTVSSIIMWIGYFDIGLTAGLRNRLSEALAKDDYERGRQLVSTAYVLLLLIFVPFGIILSAIIPHIEWSHLLNVDSSYNDELIVVMEILLSAFALQMVFSAITSILTAVQKVAMASAFPMLGNLFSLIAILILKEFTHGSLEILALSISYIPVGVLIVSSLIFFGGSLRRIRPGVKWVRMRLGRDIFSLGIQFFIIQIQLLVVYQSTNLLIAYVSSPVEVTSFNVAYRYINTASMILYVIISPLCPAFTDAFTKKDYGWMRMVYNKMTYLYAAALGCIVLMVLLAPIVFRIWVDDADISPVIMTVSVGVYVAVYSWVSIQAVLINGIGSIRIETLVTTAGMLVMVPLALLLGRSAGLGAIGIVTAMTIINVVYALCFTVQLRKILSGSCAPVWLK